MVPDFLNELPSHTGGKMKRLAELKVLNCCLSRYTTGHRAKAVDSRANLLHGEYRKKAREADRICGDRNNGELGPVERKLLQFGNIVGLVVGAFGEVSEDLHYLIQKLAESKVGSMGLRRERQATEEELGIVIGQIRRSISTTCVRAQAQCLIFRLNCVGHGLAQAFKRRKQGAYEEEKVKRERQAQ